MAVDAVCRQKRNYPHKLHLSILPAPAETSGVAFEDWSFTIENGLVLAIPSEADLPERYRSLPPEYTTCRIVRRAVLAQSVGSTAFGSS